MGYDRGDSFPFDFEPNGTPFGSKSKGKLSPRSYPIQCERKWKHSFLSVRSLPALTRRQQHYFVLRKLLLFMEYDIMSRCRHSEIIVQLTQTEKGWWNAMKRACVQFSSNLFSSKVFHPIHFVQSY